MDLNNVFKNEIFRPAVTLVGPGVIALTPYIWLIFHQHQEYQTKALENTALYSLILILLFAVAGLFIDNIGTHIEGRHDNNLKTKPGYGDHLSNWEDYWSIAFKNEPVGHRYLRTIVLKLKFELNTFVSLLIAILGFVMLFSNDALIGADTTTLIVMFTLFSIKLYSDSIQSVKLLSDIRKQVLKGVTVLG